MTSSNCSNSPPTASRLASREVIQGRQESPVMDLSAAPLRVP
jgi:hypothetical protein